ncbi:MAG: hypothetical protein QXV17_14595 [Candidatus Micrarchaeaceae archaeon]
MPVFSKSTEYSGLSIKPPITLRIHITKDQLVKARSYLGTTVGNATVDKVKFGLDITVCNVGQPDCASGTDIPALAVAVFSDRANSRWTINIYFKSYYVTPDTEIVQELMRFGQEQDIDIDVTFRDTKITVSSPTLGKRFIDTDVLKSFEQIRRLISTSSFYDTAGNSIVVNDSVLYLVVDTIPVSELNVSQILGVVLPIAVTASVTAALFAVFRHLLPSLRR